MKIWETNAVPEDWKKGFIVRLPKKGDLSSCNNWERGNTFVNAWKSLHESHPGKTQNRLRQNSEKNKLASIMIDCARTKLPPWKSSSISPFSGIPPYIHLCGFPEGLQQCGQRCHLETNAELRLSTQVHCRHPAVVWICHLPSHTQWKADQLLACTNQYPSGLFVVSDDILDGGDWIMQQYIAGQQIGIQRMFTKQLGDSTSWTTSASCLTSIITHKKS